MMSLKRLARSAEPECPSGMVRVPGGVFSMGSPAGVGDEDEHPQHEVTLAGYCMDKTEVTVAAYAQCVASGKCTAAAEPVKGASTAYATARARTARTIR
jgi:formylglycine-generating enzyme required for sulfatase activity